MTHAPTKFYGQSLGRAMPERRRRNERGRHAGCQREIGKAWAVVMLLMGQVAVLESTVDGMTELAEHRERFVRWQQGQLDELRKARSDG